MITHFSTNVQKFSFIQITMDQQVSSGIDPKIPKGQEINWTQSQPV